MSLPSGYKKLEYIQSSGTQYIDTGFKPNQNTRVVMDVTPVDVSLGKMWCAFGVRQNGIYFGLCGSNYSNYFTVEYAKRHNLEVNKNTASVDGISKSYAAQTFQFTIPLFLLGDNAAGSPTSAGAALLYSCQIYDNGTLIRDFIPCKNASGVIGLWDDVNSVFYQNAGSGTFTAGPEVKGTNKTLIDGTAYGVETGKCLISGTAYALKKGRTLIGGTGYDVKLTKNSYLITFIYEEDVSAMAGAIATLYYGTQEIQSGQTFEIQKGETLIFQNSSPYAWNYVYLYVDGKYQGSFEASGPYAPAKYEFTPTADCEIKAVLGRNESDARWYVTTS